MYGDIVCLLCIRNILVFTNNVNYLCRRTLSLENIREIYLITLRWDELEWILLKSLGRVICFCRFTFIIGVFLVAPQMWNIFLSYCCSNDILMVSNANNYRATLHQNFLCDIVGGDQLSRKNTVMVLLYNVSQPVAKCLVGLVQLWDLLHCQRTGVNNWKNVNSRLTHPDWWSVQ